MITKTIYRMKEFITIYISVSVQEFFGIPINCIVRDNKMKMYAQSLCWINGTFTRRGINMTETYVGPILEKDREYQKYYQWIVMILVLQAMLSIIPAKLWKSWERGRISQLCKSLG